MRIILIFLAIFIAGLSVTATAQGDPFDSARYYIGTKDNAAALALVDGGTFPVDQANAEGWTLLHFAAEANNLDMVKALLARGANPAVKTIWGSTPVEVAAGTMVKAAIAAALQRSAGPPPATPALAPAPGQAATRAAGGNGMCAIVRAERINDGRSPALRPWLKARDDIWYDHPDELALLLADCVDPNQTEGEARWTLLHHAAQRDRVEAAKVLLAAGANRNLRTRDGERAADLARSPEMQVLLGPKTALRPAAGATTARARDCLAKREADAALCYDTTCRMRTLTKQQQCLKTGLYY